MIEFAVIVPNTSLNHHTDFHHRVNHLSAVLRIASLIVRDPVKQGGARQSRKAFGQQPVYTEKSCPEMVLELLADQG
jgi:hypothetical protein